MAHIPCHFSQKSAHCYSAEPSPLTTHSCSLFPLCSFGMTVSSKCSNNGNVNPCTSDPSNFQRPMQALWEKRWTVRDRSWSSGVLYRKANCKKHRGQEWFCTLSCLLETRPSLLIWLLMLLRHPLLHCILVWDAPQRLSPHATFMQFRNKTL